MIQDVRGRSDSDGTLEAFQHEREDADDLFNWIAAQPWSDGNIGMWGASYLGYTTTSACTSGNPHLKTAVSEVNVGSPFYDTVRKGGTVCSWPLLCWTLAQSVSNRVDMDVLRELPACQSHTRRCSVRPPKCGEWWMYSKSRDSGKYRVCDCLAPLCTGRGWGCFCGTALA